jgi:hypothetical protein
MNVQELNSTGQPIWVFLVTAMGILLGAFWIWATFYQWSKYMHPPDGNLSYGPKGTPFKKISVWRRCGLVLWLVSHGHIIWCWRSGIVFSMFTNGRKGFRVTCGSEDHYCFCPMTIDLSDAVGAPDEHRWWYTLATHAPHAPFAYVYAHIHSEPRSKTAFSFAALV